MDIAQKRVAPKKEKNMNYYDEIKYDATSLNKMKKFYILIEKVATLSPKFM